MNSSLLEWTQSYHGYLDELFLVHQEALVANQLPLAVSALQTFSLRLKEHIGWEESLLFVCHQALPESRWPTSLYLKEHAKLDDLLGEISRQMTDVLDRPSRRAVIELIDREKSFKGVLEHHEQREEVALLAELDQSLSEDRRREMIEAATLVWPSLDGFRQQINRIAGSLDSPS